jgi:hypothetical protein
VRFCIDIDGTICETSGVQYEFSTPISFAISEVNRLYVEGHYIILFTARGSGSGINYHEVTSRQLQAWGIRYHELVFGKPFADVYIDDKAINSNIWIENLSSGKVDHTYKIVNKYHI